MHIRTYKIAQLTVEVQSIHTLVHAYCVDYLTQEPAQFQIVIRQEDIDFERIKSAREEEMEGLPVQEYTDAYLEILAVYRKLANRMLQENTLLFHGSAIAVDGQAVLFTAKSGTGKSTHTRLWREMFGSRALMVNDDKPLLRILDDGVLVCGTPWDGKHRISTNCALPLKAICILERGEQNTITPISPKEALPMVLQQSFRPNHPAGVAKLLQVVNLLSGKVAFYRLRCNMEPEAAKVAYEGMLKNAK